MSHIIAAIDFSTVSEFVISESQSLAVAFQSKLTLLHVAAPNPSFVGFEAGPQGVRDARARELREEHRMLQGHAVELQKHGIEARGVLVEGETVATILREAANLAARYIVVGSRGHGAIYNALIGGVSTGIIAGASCPVLVVPVPSGHSSDGGDALG